MKKKILSALSLLFFAVISVAQIPQGFTYQAVACDMDGVELRNQNLRVRASILRTSPNGSSEWIETHQISTDPFGLFTISIGQGIPNGGILPFFSDIKWGNDLRFLKIEIDPTGGNNFQFLGTSQIFSVPYALYSKGAEKAESAKFADSTAVATYALNGGDTDPQNELQTLAYEGGMLTISNGNAIPLNLQNDDDGDPQNEIQIIEKQGNTVTLSQNGGSFTDDVNDADADPNNELQTLNFSNGQLSIQNGNSVTIPTEDTTNELQNLSKSGNVVTLSQNGGSFTDEVNDADADPNNEIQSLSFHNGQLSISGSNSIFIPTEDSDADPFNELQTLTRTGNTISLSQNGGSFTDEVDDADADASNELQTITKYGNTVTLSQNGGSFTDEVNDGDFDPNNELQTLTLMGDLLKISNGNSVTVDTDPHNEMQTLEYEGDELKLSGSNTINFADRIFGARSASVLFPQGVFGEHIILTQGTYTVPQGKNLYLLAGGFSLKLLTGTGWYEHCTGPAMPIFSEGTVIMDAMSTGFLIDKTAIIEPVVIDFKATPLYTIPAGKMLVLKSGFDHDKSSKLKVNNHMMEFFRPNLLRSSQLVCFKDGTTLQRPNLDEDLILTGYLFDYQ